MSRVLLSWYINDDDISEMKKVAEDVLGPIEQLSSSTFTKKYLGKEDEGSKSSEIAADSSIPTLSSGNQLPEVRSTNVLGIKLLKQMLNPLHENELDAYEKQVRLEEEAYDAALARLKSINEARQDPLLNTDTGSIRSFMSDWLPKLTALIEEEVQLCKNSSPRGK